MNTLIAYATRHGTTEKCASLLSKKLSGTVDLYNMKNDNVPNLLKYDSIIIGGSIYAGKILNEVNTFCSQNLDYLKSKKIGLFICCMFKDNAEAQLNSAFPPELLSKAAVRGCFGGELRLSEMSFGERLITKMVSKTVAKNDPILSSMDPKKGISMIAEENIDRFAEQMNSI